MIVLAIDAISRIQDILKKESDSCVFNGLGVRDGKEL
jgi:hypothetical protein